MKSLEQIKDKLKNMESLAQELGEEINEQLKGTIDALKWVLKDEESLYEELNDYTGEMPEGVKIDIEAVEE